MCVCIKGLGNLPRLQYRKKNKKNSLNIFRTDIGVLRFIMMYICISSREDRKSTFFSVKFTHLSPLYKFKEYTFAQHRKETYGYQRGKVGGRDKSEG